MQERGSEIFLKEKEKVREGEGGRDGGRKEGRERERESQREIWERERRGRE